MNTYKIRRFSKSFTDRFPVRGQLGRVFLYGATMEIEDDGTAFLLLGSGVRRELMDEERESLAEEL